MSTTRRSHRCPPDELDAIHSLDFERDLHPRDRPAGRVAALDTIRFAITTHRGCYGECHFCAIAVHQGRTIQNRSVESIVREADVIAAHPAFKGTHRRCWRPDREHVRV